VRGILPSAAVLKEQVGVYAADSGKAALQCLSKATSSAAFQDVYEISLAAFTALGGLADRNLRPSLAPARSLVLRTPLLVGIGQQTVAEAELRRFVELLLWTIYFTDHPVEWRDFLRAVGTGFSQDLRKPISYSAHRQLRFYLDYALELMSSEPSGLAAKAGRDLDQTLRRLNAASHAGQLARGSVRTAPHDDLSEPTLREFARIQRSTFASCTILLAAYRRRKFDRLNAISRAYFDWLIGSRLKKEVRGGPFGLA
jgi:hypothetical protein